MSRRPRSTNVRESALREATRLFSERGVAAVSLQEVADAVGTSKQALLYHFPSKDALRDAVIDAVLTVTNERLAELVGRMGEAGALGDEVLTGLLREVEELFESHPWAAPLILRLILDRDTQALERIQEGARPWLGQMVAFIRRGQTAGLVRPELDLEAVAVQVGSLILANFALLPLHGWTESPAAEWRRRRLTEMVRAVRAILLVSPDRGGQSGGGG